MTNLEALKAVVSYPLSDNAFIKVLTDRGLTDSATYSASSAFELAQADAIMILVSAPNVTEGGYSVSQSDKKALVELANGIYERNGVAPVIPKPTAKFVQRW